MIENVEATLDQELAARKITLSAQTRSLCLTVIKAVLKGIATAETPVNGTSIRGVTLSPEKARELEDAIRNSKGFGMAPQIVLEEYPCHALPRDQWCDRDGPGGFMGHTCRSFSGHSTYSPSRDL